MDEALPGASQQLINNARSLGRTLRAAILGEPPTLGEVVVVRRMTNAKAMGPDNLPAELFKLGVRASSRLLVAFYGIILRIWKEQKVPQLWKDAVIPVLLKTKDPN